MNTLTINYTEVLAAAVCAPSAVIEIRKSLSREKTTIKRNRVYG